MNRRQFLTSLLAIPVVAAMVKQGTKISDIVEFGEYTECDYLNSNRKSVKWRYGKMVLKIDTDIEKHRKIISDEIKDKCKISQEFTRVEETFLISPDGLTVFFDMKDIKA